MPVPRRYFCLFALVLPACATAKAPPSSPPAPTVIVTVQTAPDATAPVIAVRDGALDGGQTQPPLRPDVPRRFGTARPAPPDAAAPDASAPDARARDAAVGVARDGEEPPLRLPPAPPPPPPPPVLGGPERTPPPPLPIDDAGRVPLR
jgi:Wiskott-Aldrich syndrome protein